MASYMPTKRQATVGPLILGILLFSALSVNHLEEHQQQLARFMASGQGIKPIPFDPNAKPSMLRGALGAVYLTQDYERRTDFKPMDTVANAFQTIADEKMDPCIKQFQTTTNDGAKVVGIMTLPNCTTDAKEQDNQGEEEMEEKQGEQ
jgi:hypothetical protein